MLVVTVLPWVMIVSVYLAGWVLTTGEVPTRFIGLPHWVFIGSIVVSGVLYDVLQDWREGHKVFERLHRYSKPCHDWPNAKEERFFIVPKNFMRGARLYAEDGYMWIRYKSKCLKIPSSCIRIERRTKRIGKYQSASISIELVRNKRQSLTIEWTESLRALQK